MELQPFLYRLRLTEAYQNPENWTEKDWASVESHASFFNLLGKSGRLLFAGRSQMMEGHINSVYLSVIMAENMDDAEKLLANDPLVSTGMYSAELNPYRFTMLYPKNFPVAN